MGTYSLRYKRKCKLASRLIVDAIVSVENIGTKWEEIGSIRNENMRRFEELFDSQQRILQEGSGRNSNQTV